MGGERASTTRQREQGKICARCKIWLDPLPGHGYGERLCAKCSPPVPRTYEVLMNFQSDAQARDGYSVTFLLPDARTSVGRRYAIESADRLRALVQRTKPQRGTLDELDRDLARWDRGSVHLYLTEQEFRDLAAGKRKNLKK